MTTDDIPPIIVTLDTSEVIRSSFDFKGPFFRGLATAQSEGRIRLVFVTVTVREIEQYLAEKAREVAAAFRKMTMLKNSTLLDFGALTEAVTPDALVEDLLSQWRAFLSETKAELLDLNGVDLPGIVDSYFENKPPFGKKGKKSEFPDAIVLERLRMYSQKIYEPIHICSQDGDFSSACDGTTLIFHPSIGSVLGLANQKREAGTAALAYLKERYEESDEVNEWLTLLVEEMPSEVDSEPDASIVDLKIFDIEINQWTVVEIAKDRVDVGFDCTIRFECHVELGRHCGYADEDDSADINGSRKLECVATVALDESTVKPTEISKLEIFDPQVLTIWTHRDNVCP